MVAAAQATSSLTIPSMSTARLFELALLEATVMARTVLVVEVSHY
jgi:hypothetical protein